MVFVLLKDFEGFLFVNVLGFGLLKRCLEKLNECVFVLERFERFEVEGFFLFIFDFKVY